MNEERSEKVRIEASSFLGRGITDGEWKEAFLLAERKLERIIAREGDDNGIRRQSWYIGKLVEEEIRANKAKKGHFQSEPLNIERRDIYENSYSTA